jgi:hypothetical protein
VEECEVLWWGLFQQGGQVLPSLLRSPAVERWRLGSSLEFESDVVAFDTYLVASHTSWRRQA